MRRKERGGREGGRRERGGKGERGRGREEEKYTM